MKELSFEEMRHFVGGMGDNEYPPPPPPPEGV